MDTTNHLNILTMKVQGKHNTSQVASTHWRFLQENLCNIKLLVFVLFVHSCTELLEGTKRDLANSSDEFQQIPSMYWSFQSYVQRNACDLQ